MNKKGITKFLLAYTCALLIVMPFFNINVLKAATLEYDYEYSDISIYELPAYQYFFNNGYTTSLGGGVGSINESINYTIDVINRTTGAYVGQFGGYQQGSTSTAQMVCGISDTGQRNCAANYAISIRYTIPHLYYNNINLNKPIMSNVYNHNTTNSQYITVSKNNTYVFAFVFYNDSQMWAFPTVQLEYKDIFPNNGRANYNMGSISLYGAEVCIIEFELIDDGSHEYSYFDIFFSNYQGYKQSITPLYLGFKKNIPNDLYTYIYGSDRITTLIENGNNESQQSSNDFDNLINDNQSDMDSYFNYNDTFVNDFDSNINAINYNYNINSNSKYLSAIQFVKSQFDLMVQPEPVFLMINISLLLGIALILIGRRIGK